MCVHSQMLVFIDQRGLKSLQCRLRPSSFTPHKSYCELYTSSCPTRIVILEIFITKKADRIQKAVRRSTTPYIVWMHPTRTHARTCLAHQYMLSRVHMCVLSRHISCHNWSSEGVGSPRFPSAHSNSPRYHIFKTKSSCLGILCIHTYGSFCVRFPCSSTRGGGELSCLSPHQEPSRPSSAVPPARMKNRR